MAEKKIGDRTFRVQAMLARDALSIMGRIGKVAGPAWDNLRLQLGTLQKGADSEGMMMLGIDAVVTVLTSNSTAEVVDLVSDLAACAECRAPSGAYDQVDLDGHFTGRLSEIPQVIAFVLQENFADFFAAKSRNGSRLSKAAA